MTDEGPESNGLDGQRSRLLQRGRVLETCVAELEARRAAEPKKKRQTALQALTGPQISEHMSSDIRTVDQDANLQVAGQLMQKWKVGSLLVTDKQTFVGLLTDSALARDVIVHGLNPASTLVRKCMRAPVVSIEGHRPILDAVRLMKEQGTRHVAVTQDGAIIGVISVSNILRYYSGVA